MTNIDVGRSGARIPSAIVSEAQMLPDVPAAVRYLTRVHEIDLAPMVIGEDALKILTEKN